jgi:hypothetical protein
MNAFFDPDEGGSRFLLNVDSVFISSHGAYPKYDTIAIFTFKSK